MNTNKKKTNTTTTPITSKDIETIREYRDKLEALNQEKPKGKLTLEEWQEAMEEIHRTGKIPSKYAGRIAANEVEVLDGMEPILDDNGNPVFDEKGEPCFKYVRYDEPQKKITYYDIADEDRNKRYRRLEKIYHDSIIKALQAYFDRIKGNEIEEDAQGTGIAAIITELLEDPLIRKELEKEAAAAQNTALTPLGSVPNGEPINWLFRVISSSKGGRMVQASTKNRHEIITTVQSKDSFRFVRENKENGSKVIVEIAQADKYLQKTNKTFLKMLIFTLQKMTAQNNPLKVGFSLQELVDLGMYANTSNAGRAVKAFFEQQKLTTLSGTVKKGRKTVKEEGGVLFYHYEIENGFVTLSVNENFNLDFIANYFTIFPRFAYALGNNAFTLVRYIFYLARQNTKAIKEKGSFTISLEAVRENLGLPSVDEVKNRKYRQFIIEPIEKAIEEIEEALVNVPEAKEYGFTITPHKTETNNIKEWLQGYLEIGLNGDFAETYIQIATKAEKDRTQWERIKTAELARIAARQEAIEPQTSAKKKHKKQ